MPYNVTWLYPKRVILAEAIGNVTIEELIEAVQTLGLMLETAQAPVYMISDSKGIKSYPNQVARVSSAVNALKTHGHKLGEILMVDTNPIIRFIANIVTQVVISTHSRSVNSVEDAITYLRKVDKSFNDAEWISV